MKRTMMAACILSLVACGGSKDDVSRDQRDDWAARQASLVYSFPDNQQQQVPVPAPVVLRFSSPVAETAPDIRIQEVASGSYISSSELDLEWVDGKRGLIITPNNKLKPLTEYRVVVPAIELERGTAAARNIRFTTRGLYEGPKSQVAEDDFKVVRTIPDGTNFPIMDFSSFRVQFSQPLDRSTVSYGNGANDTLRLMGPEGLVEAYVLVSGNYLTVDPKEDLMPGVEYRLELTKSITSIYGDALPAEGSLDNPNNPIAQRLTLSAKDTTSPTTGERVSMVQDIANTGELSPLTGQPINLVPMSSVLLGKDTATQASGTIAAELAFVPNFPDITPFRVHRGSLIEGASIEVLIGGEVPAGFESGKVRMDFLSDAAGYLLPNPFSNADDAPRQVRLFMDVAVSTETPSANGAITQDLLHIELVGTSIVEDGQMVINAVGVVEPNVLGAERATGVLSFYMKAYEDQDNPPSIAPDNRVLAVQSWSHEEPRHVSVDDPIVVNFTAPIDPSGVGDIRLTEIVGGVSATVAVKVESKGSAVLITPERALVKPHQQSNGSSVPATLIDAEYELEIPGSLKGISGTSMIPETLVFKFSPVVSESTWTEVLAYPFEENGPAHNKATLEQYSFEDSPLNQAVVLLMAYPGSPCAIDASEQDIAGNIAGRCAGTLSWTKESMADGPIQPADDLLPIPVMPENGVIVIQGSQDFDPQSVQLGGSFIVESYDDSTGNYSPVDGDVEVRGARIEFRPKDPWTAGSVYRYILRSNGDDIVASNQTVCDGTQSICDKMGRPLQTKLYEANKVENPDGSLVDSMFIHRVTEGRAGGPDVVNLFRVIDSQGHVFQAMVASSVDTNANFFHDVDHRALYPSLDPDGFPIKNDDFMMSTMFQYWTTDLNEEGVDSGVLDPNAHPVLDVGGVAPIPNSAKILPLPATRAVLEMESGFPVMTPALTYSFEEGYLFGEFGLGCGFEQSEGFHDVLLGVDLGTHSMQELFDLERPRISCPERKFTYLHSAIGAHVTGEYEPGKGIKVLIWPGQIVGTSLSVYTIHGGASYSKLESGKQVMRMRYAKDDADCVDTVTQACRRSQPIVGYINNENGRPVMSADVDLYVDAAGLGVHLNIIPGLRHNMLSVPVTMSLKGEISFDENGQMLIEQINQNDVVFSYELTQNIEEVNFFGFIMPLDPPVQILHGIQGMMVPSGGSLIQYKSDIIR